MPGGFGGGPWGGSPWGSAAAWVSPSLEFDIYCFFGCAAIGGILAHPDVSVFGEPTYFTVTPSPDCDLNVRVDGTAPQNYAHLYVTTTVPNSWTLEFTLRINDIPADFSDLVNHHIFVGTTDASGPCAGLFISQLGLMYAGAVHHDGFGNLVVDTIAQFLPDSTALITTGAYLTFRIAASETTGAVYIYVTPTVMLPTTGHQLKYIMPVIPATAAATPPSDRTIFSVRGDALSPTDVDLDELCLGTGVLIPNVAPVADAGQDVAARICSIIQLDGSASFDPEGAPLVYLWRLIDAPSTSMFAVEGHDGRTYPIDATGLTNKFHSPVKLATLSGTDPVIAGDVLLLRGQPRTIVSTGVDGNGYFLLFGSQDIPDNIGTTEPFKVLRQRGINEPETVNPTFFPDVTGFYKFDLIVNDGALTSEESSVIINVLESPLPRGVVPDVEFIFSFLSDFWGLVEGKERVPVLWSGIAQVAAGELLTLWQHDYAKSLRDIQRQFNRKWLHYDLLLPEPIPELTTVRTVWGGVYSSAIPPLGVGGVSGTTLVITSDALAADISVPFTKANPYTADDLKFYLRELIGRDARFDVKVVTDTSTSNQYVRINAPFPFTVSSTSTIPVFTPSDQNVHPSGSSGGALASNTYRVDVSLEGLGIVENDFLCLDGVAYRIDKIVTDSSDDYAYQRIVTKEPLPTVPSADWAISSYVTSELLDFYNGLVARGDVVFFEVLDERADYAPSAHTSLIVRTDVLGVNEALPSRLAVDATAIGSWLVDPDTKVLLAKVLRRTYLPVDSLVLDVPYLSDRIVIETTEQEEQALRRNLDFFIEETRGRNSLRFVSGLDGDPDVWEQQDPPDRLWAEFTYLDNRPTIEENFGVPAEFTLDQLAELDSNIDYLSAVRGLWYAYFNGPTLRNMRVGVQILLGLPFAEEAGTIEEIRTDFSPTQGRILIRDTADQAIVRSYQYPKTLNLEVNPETGVVYVVGDTVTQFAPLVTGAEVVDYVKDPRWFEGMLNQGIFFEVEKFHKFLVRVDSAAFDPATILFVRNFILKIKPTYTFPVLLVRVEQDVAEVSVDDQLSARVRVILNETPCGGWLGSATMWDDFRSAGGGARSQYDSDANPNNAPPTFPTPDSTILWGYDKGELCPEATAELEVSTNFYGDGDVIRYDAGFRFDTPPVNVAYFFHWYPGGTAFIPVSPGTAPIPFDSFSEPTNIVRKTGSISRAWVHTTRNVASSYDPRIAAWGSITTITGSLLVDGETFTIDDGYNAVTFEFDDDSSVTPGNVAIPFTSADSADQVRNTIISTINNLSLIRVTASTGGPALVDLVHDEVGVIGNNVIVETVANAGFVVAGLSGGLDASDFILLIYVNAVLTASVSFDVLKAGFPNISQEVSISPPVAVTATPSTGSITTIAGSLLVDGETFQLDDGINAVTTFEFNSSGGVGAGNLPVPFTAGDTADQIRDAIIAAVNAAPNLDIVATSGGAATVTLTHFHGGPNTNVTQPADGVANVGFVVSNLTGGAGDTVTVALRAGSGADKSYPWNLVRVRLFQDSAYTGWSFDDTLPTGTYSMPVVEATP